MWNVIISHIIPPHLIIYHQFPSSTCEDNQQEVGKSLSLRDQATWTSLFLRNLYILAFI